MFGNFLQVIKEKESIYSWLTRNVLLSGLPTTNTALKSILATRSKQLASNFPGYIPETKCYTSIPENKLINEHTCLPLFRLFCGLTTYQKALQSLLEGNTGPLHSQLSIVANRVSSKPMLKYCNCCRESDLKAYGVSFWHIEHQLPGVTVCIKHGFRLQEYKCSRRELILPEHIDYQTEYYSLLVEFRLSTVLVEMWSDLGRECFDRHKLQSCYRHQLTNLGLASKPTAIRQDKLKKRFNSFWKASDCVIVQTLLNDPHFPEVMFRNESANHHPVKHALLISLLWKSWPEFLIAYDTCEISLSVEQERKIDLNSNQKADFERKVINLINEGQSMRSVANKLNTSVTTTKQIALRNKLNVESRAQKVFAPEKGEILRLLEAGKATEVIARKFGVCQGVVEQILSQNPTIVDNRKKKRYLDRRTVSRAKVQEIIKNNPNAKRGEIQKKYRSLYTWLFKNDKGWLNEHLPPAIKRQHRYKYREK